MIANVGTNDVRSTIRAGKEAQETGADALLVVVPPYAKPTQGGMLEFFGAVADATTLPVIVYNIPGRTAANMLPGNLARAQSAARQYRRRERIQRRSRADCDHPARPAGRLYGVVGRRLSVSALACDRCRRRGRRDLASVFARVSAMVDAFERGDVKAAAAIHNGLAGSHRRALYGDQPDRDQVGDGRARL